LIEALRQRVGELRYLGAAGASEADDPAPAYAAGDPEAILVVEPGRGVRFTVRQCLE
jgi:hypothetical protein